MFHEMTSLLSCGGFRLTKWISSSREVLSQIPPEEKASPSVDVNFDKLPIERTPGLKWNTETDCFCFSVCSHQTYESTKRGVLSRLSTMFDPLGVLAPYILPAKCLIQSLWRKNKGWDEPLDEEDQRIWEDWLGDLMKLSEFELPRCFCVDTCPEASIQLHVFTDASEKGFGAVCYARYSLPDGSIKVSFVMARNRVAPLKQLSIPRLELQAAVLAVRLYCLVKQELTVKVEDTIFWSDSKTVLQYIAKKKADAFTHSWLIGSQRFMMRTTQRSGDMSLVFGTPLMIAPEAFERRIWISIADGLMAPPSYLNPKNTGPKTRLLVLSE